MATSYDATFFDIIRDGCRRSADVVAPLVVNTLGWTPWRVIDVGCGEGWWGHAFAELGSDVLGVDGDYVRNPVINFQPRDLNQPLDGLGEWDLAVCLEVAEHLPPERAESFVADLCKLAPLVLFSAAIPGQGGHGHLNEQWPGYWVDLFEAEGFQCSGALRWAIWNDGRVENWYRQNLLIASSYPDSLSIFDGPLAEPLPLVHPVLYNARRA